MVALNKLALALINEDDPRFEQVFDMDFDLDYDISAVKSSNHNPDIEQVMKIIDDKSER